MAAIDFPSNPTIGQSLSVNGRTWIWDGTVWANQSSRDFVRTVSDTAPENPQVGDEWFNSANGRLYNFYDSYWIEIGAAVQGPSGLVAAIPPLLYDAGSQTLSIDQNSITSTIISDTEPEAAVSGARWIKSTTWQEFVYYNNEWIELI